MNENIIKNGLDIKSLNSAIDNEIKNDGSFPVDIFPNVVQELISNATETVNFNPEYFSAGILSACATAIGNSVKLHNGSFASKPILWLCIIGRPGLGKTHPLKFAKKPIEIKDGQSYVEYQEKIQEYELAEKERISNKPRYSKFILNDFTPEKLAETLQHNGKGVLIFQDELMRWINSFDQYKKGGDQQLYLDLFNGSNLSVDRVSKEPILIPEANVNILGGMQPKIINHLAKNSRSDDGFLDRLLFVFPRRVEPNLFTGKDILQLHKENYTRLVNNLIEVPNFEIVANESNIKIFQDWQHHTVQKYFKDEEEQAIQAKMETYVWRFALIIEMIDQAAKEHFAATLKDESLNKAIRLAEYFRHISLKIRDLITSINPLETLSAAQLELYEALPSEFKRKDVLDLLDCKGISYRSGDRFFRKKELFFSSTTSSNLKIGQYRKKIKV